MTKKESAIILIKSHGNCNEPTYIPCNFECCAEDCCYEAAFAQTSEFKYKYALKYFIKRFGKLKLVEILL